MESMTSDPPAAVVQDVARLRAALDETLPGKDDSNLLIGTWNVRAFGDLTRKWAAGPRDSPKRDLHAMACIAAVPWIRTGAHAWMSRSRDGLPPGGSRTNVGTPPSQTGTSNETNILGVSSLGKESPPIHRYRPWTKLSQV